MKSSICPILTTHHSPLTTHHSPLTTHHSPLTTHHSPLFFYQQIEPPIFVSAALSRRCHRHRQLTVPLLRSQKGKLLLLFRGLLSGLLGGGFLCSFLGHGTSSVKKSLGRVPSRRLPSCLRADECWPLSHPNHLSCELCLKSTCDLQT
jgi:hypothetical protein